MPYSFLPDALLSVGLGRFLNFNARASFACLPSTFMIKRLAWSELCLHSAFLQWSPPWPHVPLSSWHSNTAVSPGMTSSTSTCAHGSDSFSSASSPSEIDRTSARATILPPLPMWPGSSTRFVYAFFFLGLCLLSWSWRVERVRGTSCPQCSMPLLFHAALSQTSEVRFTSYAGLELGSHGNTRMLL